MRFAFSLLTFTLLVASAVLSAGCKTTADSPAENGAVQEVPVMEDGIVATVKYIELEGGFYGIEDENGQTYYPINLTEDYKEDGLRIMFKYKARTDIMTTVMWGTPVEITAIELQN